MLVRWIDGSAAGVRFSLVAGFMRGEDFVPLKGGPRIIAQGASLDIPAMRELRDKLGFKPVAGGRPALWHHLDGKLSTFGLKAAVPGLRAYTVEREAVTVTPRLGESAPSAPAVMPPPSRSIPLPPMVLGRNLRDETVYSDPDGRRWVRLHNGRREEMPARGGARFLRADPDDASNLYDCACVLVAEAAAGIAVTAARLRQFAGVVFGAGGEVPVNDLRLRRFQEAFEAGMVGALATAEKPSLEAFEKASQLYERQPIFGARTSTSLEYQQFSTPLPMAVVASFLAAPEGGAGLKVYDPAIGNGALVALLHNAEVIGSDLDPARIDASRRLPQVRRVRNLNTLNLTPDEARGADIVIANPPFGPLPQAEVYNGELRVRRQDYLMALRALEARKEDGRAILIVAADSPVESRAGEVTGGSRHFFNWLQDHYHVEAAVEIDGSLYDRQGAGFPVRMLVIGKRGPGGLQVPDHLPVIRDYAELWEWATRTVEARGAAIAEAQKAEAERLKADEINEYQTRYVPASRIGEPTLMVPRNLSVPLRECLTEIEERRGPIDEFVARELRWTVDELQNYLSPEQVDAVAIALDRQDTGAGFVVADQTGIGKGRIMASLLRRALLSGQRPVFITEKAHLFTDIYRDLADIGMGSDVRPFILNADARVLDRGGREIFRSPTPADLQWALDNGDVPGRFNCVFATYSQFNRDFDDSGKARWLAAIAQRQPLLLDESHNAAGDSHTFENLVRAVAASDSVTYSSATFMKRAENVGIYYRVFPKVDDAGIRGLQGVLQTGGETLLEALSGMLARSGAMVRREHNLRDVTFRTLTEVNPARYERNIAAANQLAEILSGMMYLSGDVQGVVGTERQRIKDELKKLPEEARKGSRMSASTIEFGSRLYQISKQFYAVLKVDAAAERALDILRRGEKPVVFSEGTGEALLREILDEDNAAFGLLPENESGVRMPQFRDLLHIVLERLRNVTQTDHYGMVTKKDVSELVETQEQREQIESVIGTIHNLIETFPDLPLAPLDVLRERIAKAGYDCEELSGRSQRLAFDASGQVVLEAVPSQNKSEIINAFQGGALDALVITRTASAGISLHAAATAKDQRPRTLIIIDPPGDINALIQVMGRVNRYGQVARPTIEILGSGVTGEFRHQMMLNRKLRQLSANVTSNQDSAGLNREVPDILNSVGNRVCMRFLAENPEIAKRLKIEVAEDEESPDPLRFVNRLTSRILLLSDPEQRTIYDVLYDEYQAILEELEREGQNPLKAQRLNLVEPRIEHEEIFQSGSGADTNDPFDMPVLLREVSHEVRIEPMRRAMVEGHVKEGRALLASRGAASDDGGRSARALRRVVERHRVQLSLDLENTGKTYEEVMDASGGNAFRRAFEAVEKVDELLDKLEVGQRIKFWNPADNELIDGLLVRLEPPSPGNERFLGRYLVDIAVPGEAGARVFSFNQLPWASAIEVSDAEDDLYQRFDSASKVQRRERRLWLTGNLFEAASLAMGMLKCGSMASYVDAEGQVQRGILLPRNMTAQRVQELPVLLKTPELALAFFAAHEDSALGTSLNQRPGDDVMLGRDYAGHTVLSVPGTRSKGGEYVTDKELRALVGDFSGDRRRMTVNVPRNHLEPVIERLYGLGTKFVVGPEYRDWVNQTREHLTRAKVAGAQEVEAEEAQEAMAATGSLSH